jgi:hypothetical protein
MVLIKFDSFFHTLPTFHTSTPLTGINKTKHKGRERERERERGTVAGTKARIQVTSGRTGTVHAEGR